jgi:hypothetical protein
MSARDVQHCLHNFAQQAQDALDFVDEAQNFRIRAPDGSHRYIGIRRVELFAGLALFKIHLAWETFLESVFTRYMCGAVSVLATGFTPQLLGIPEPTISVAISALLRPNQNYLNWTPQNTTR